VEKALSRSLQGLTKDNLLEVRNTEREFINSLTDSSMKENIARDQRVAMVQYIVQTIKLHMKANFIKDFLMDKGVF
jgi:hypothetical protein